MALSPEDKERIKTGYRNAEDPQKQIGILAELHGVSKNVVCEVLGLPQQCTNAPKPRAKVSVHRRETIVKQITAGQCSKQEAAEKYDISIVTINRWLREAAAPPAETHRKLATPNPEFEAAVKPMFDEFRQERPLKMRSAFEKICEGWEMMSAHVSPTDNEEMLIGEYLNRCEGFVLGVEYAAKNILREGEAKIGDVQLDYCNDLMSQGLFGHKVYYRYDPEDLSSVRVYDLEDRLLTIAPAASDTVVKYGASKEELTHALKRIREVERAQKVLLANSGLPEGDRIAALELLMDLAAQNEQNSESVGKGAKVLHLHRPLEEPLFGQAIGYDIDTMLENAEQYHNNRGGLDDE